MTSTTSTPMSPRSKPRVSLRGYVPGRYNVLVCRLDGEVFIAWSGTYKQAAFRQAVKYSPSRDTLTHRSCVVRPGESLAVSVNSLIREWKPPEG